MKKNKYNINISINTSAGVKKNNEDAAWVGFNKSNQCLAIVCDGISSEKNSEIASSTIVDVFKTYFLNTSVIHFPKHWFKKILKLAYQELNIIAAKAKIVVGTTLVMTLISGDVAYVFNIGDSRAYYYNIDFHNWKQVTVDHNLYTFLQTHNAPQISYIKNKDRLLALTQFIDSESTKHMEFSYNEIKFKANDVFFIASDGMYNYININKINEVISTNRINGFENICAVLTQSALENQSNDNISGIILEIIDKSNNY